MPFAFNSFACYYPCETEWIVTLYKKYLETEVILFICTNDRCMYIDAVINVVWSLGDQIELNQCI